MGSAPVERLSVPALLQPGETAKMKKVSRKRDSPAAATEKGRTQLGSLRSAPLRCVSLQPDIKLPWKRYIAFGDEAQLKAEITDKEFASVLNIWVDEVNTVVLTEKLQEDGVRALKVQSWAAWSAAKKMAPVAYKYTTTKEAFISDFHGKMIAGMEPHLHSKDIATVRHESDLPSDELQFMELRGKVTRKAIESITGMDLSSLTNMQLPKIQICASGGGYRAMIATLGALIGMEEFGLLDAVTAMTGLSGSTWAMAAWYAGGKSLVDTRARLAETLSAPFYTNKLWPDTVKVRTMTRLRALWGGPGLCIAHYVCSVALCALSLQSHVKERMGFDQELGLVDVMGWHLYNHCAFAPQSKQSLAPSVAMIFPARAL